MVRNQVLESAWHLACDRRDARYDGVFYVAVTSTRIYCRPVCPSRRARPERRRFFHSREDAEAAGYRACRRCRPDLERGRAPVDSLARLAQRAASAIDAGALNGRTLRDLAADFGVSDRHLRRALLREFGLTSRDLTVARRLSLAHRLLVTTNLRVIQIAYESGFQSLRRFNAAFREQHGMSPTEARRSGRMAGIAAIPA